MGTGKYPRVLCCLQQATFTRKGPGQRFAIPGLVTAMRVFGIEFFQNRIKVRDGLDPWLDGR